MQVFNLHPNPFSPGRTLTVLRRLICEHIRNERMGFQPEKRMKTEAKSCHSDFRSHPVLCRDAISFQAKGRLGHVCAWAGNEAALWLGEHSPRQSWARPTGTVSPATGCALAWVYQCQILLQRQQPCRSGDATRSRGTFLGWSCRCLAVNSISPAGHQQAQ